MKTFTAILMIAAVTLALAIGCASLPSQHQRIAAACEGVAASVDAIAAGRVAGRVSQADGKKAEGIARATVPFCEPEPVASLSAVDFAALLRAGVELSALAGGAK